MQIGTKMFCFSYTLLGYTFTHYFCTPSPPLFAPPAQSLLTHVAAPDSPLPPYKCSSLAWASKRVHKCRYKLESFRKENTNKFQPIESG